MTRTTRYVPPNRIFNSEDCCHVSTYEEGPSSSEQRTFESSSVVQQIDTLLSHPITIFSETVLELIVNKFLTQDLNPNSFLVICVRQPKFH